MHAEANAIISASREEMLGATLYLAMRDESTGLLVPDASPCNMCRRMIINAGIETVVVRKDKQEFTTYSVSRWVEEDDVLPEDQLSTY